MLKEGHFSTRVLKISWKGLVVQFSKDFLVVGLVFKCLSAFLLQEFDFILISSFCSWVISIFFEAFLLQSFSPCSFKFYVLLFCSPYLTLSALLKITLSPSKKKCFICFNESLLKNDEKCFLFCLKALFVLRYLNLCVDFLIL